MAAFDAVKHMQTENVVLYLEHMAVAMGCDNQRERYDAGVLPDDELLQLARAELFKGFDFKRWHSRECREEMLVVLRLKHRHGCRADGASGRFEVQDVGELLDVEWEKLKQISGMVAAVNMHPWMIRSGATATVDSCAHWVTCPECHAEVVRSVAKVSIPWAGRVLVREFVL